MKHSKNFIDLTGQRFGRLTVLGIDHRDEKSQTFWKCKCDCGNEKIVNGVNLRKGSTKSCGCLLRDYPKLHYKTHGETNTRLYGIWNGIKMRCYNSNRKSFKNYGDRGITMCDEWKENYTVFRDWAYKNGYSEKLSIERKNNNLGYTPDNCIWADTKTQARNRRTSVVVTYKGKTGCLKEICELNNVNYKRVRKRIKHSGWTLEEAIETPLLPNDKTRKERRKKYESNRISEGM